MTFFRTLFVFFVLFQVLVSQVTAQQNLIYNHYFLNPYLFNPSFIAPNGYSELNLNFRRQWTEFEGAPTTLTANLQMPINYKMGWGINLYNDKAGVIETNTGVASFAYQVYLGRSTEANHKIGFGLSFGYSMSRVDLSKVDDPTDPSLSNTNTSNLDGQFGFHYQFNDLKIGFALPSLFATKLVSEENFNTPEFDALKNTFSSISYNMQFNERLALEPFLIYRTNEISKNQFEVMAVLKIDRMMWVGGLYRQDYGPAAFFGFDLKQKLKVGYSYQFSPEVIEGFGNATHELHVSLRLGKKQVSRPTPTTTAAEPVEEPAKQEEIIEKTEPQEIPAEIPVVMEQPKQEVPVVQPQADQPHQELPVEQPVVSPEEKPEEAKVVVAEKLDLPTGNYVIVGAFKYSPNANKYANELKANGFPSTVTYSAVRNYYYVHVGNFTTLDEARTIRNEYRAKSRFFFRDAWILSVEE